MYTIATVRHRHSHIVQSVELHSVLDEAPRFRFVGRCPERWGIDVQERDIDIEEARGTLLVWRDLLLEDELSVQHEDSLLMESHFDARHLEMLVGDAPAQDGSEPDPEPEPGAPAPVPFTDEALAKFRELLPEQQDAFVEACVDNDLLDPRARDIAREVLASRRSSLPRDFVAELEAARAAEDWDAHARIWEERRLASVEADETVLGRMFNDQLPPREEEADEPAPETLDPAAPRTVTILAEYRDEAIKELGKLVRKAQRYGNPDISFTLGPVYHETVKRRSPLDGKWRDVPGPDKIDITVQGAAPRVGPYTFLAKVDHGEGGNVLDIIPGETVDPRFRSTPSMCEHCQKDRRRNETFVLRHGETGEQVQVGRTCLKDYLGYEAPAGLLQRFSFLRDFAAKTDEWEGSSGRWGETFLVDEVLAASAVAIRLYGWCSKGQAQVEAARGGHVEATAYIVSAFLSPPRVRDKHNEDIFRRNKEIEAAVEDPQDIVYAGAILDWLRGGGAGDGDYGYNLKTVCERGVIEGKRLGLVCSAVQAYERAMEREVRRTREREEAKVSQWQGTEGQRLRDVPVSQQSARVVSSNDWGQLILVKFIDEAGNLYSWFTSSGTGFNDGSKLLLTGTVKRHSEYKEVRETQLSRCILKAA